MKLRFLIFFSLFIFPFCSSEKDDDRTGFWGILENCAMIYCQSVLLDRCHMDSISFTFFTKACVKDSNYKFEKHVAKSITCKCFVDNEFHILSGLKTPFFTVTNSKYGDKYGGQENENGIIRIKLKDTMSIFSNKTIGQSHGFKRAVFKNGCDVVELTWPDSSNIWRNLIHRKSIFDSNLPLECLDPRYSEIVFYQSNDDWFYRYAFISHDNINEISLEILDYINANPDLFSGITEIFCPIFRYNGCDNN